MKLFTAAQMRELDRRAIQECNIPSLTLMESAAQRVVDHLDRVYGPLEGKRIAVVCGKGNNGGDGLAIARLLHVHHGTPVRVFLAADPDALSDDAAVNLDNARSAGVPVAVVTNDELMAGIGGWDLVVDAVLGTGVRGGASGLVAAAIDAVNKAGCPVVAVDVPSGVDADTGAVDGPAVAAKSTVTFAAGKLGLWLFPAAALAGDIEIVDIGIPAHVIEEAEPAAWLTDSRTVASSLPSRDPSRDSNKGTFGHVTVLAGSAGYLGAAVLAASAAARSGAGLVTLCVPSSLLDAAMAAAPPVVMTRGLPETGSRRFSHAGLAEALKTAERGTAAAIGPGVGQGDPDTAAFVIEFVRACPVPLVVDADGLNILSSQLDQGASVIGARSAATVLTPHPGEMGRLLARKTAEIQKDRMGAVRQAAAAFRCPLILKGMRTLVASPDGAVHINPTGNPGMATGGTGDVLTGVAAALLGMKQDAADALRSAVFLHGLAGDLAAHDKGVDGLIATDVVDYLPAAFRSVRQSH